MHYFGEKKPGFPVALFPLFKGCNTQLMQKLSEPLTILLL